MSLDPPTADRELRAVAALGREFRRLDLMPERPRRFAVPRRRRIAMFAVLMALLSVGSVGAATGLIPVGTEHESLVLDSGDTVHTVVATGSSPVAGHWRVESYRGGALFIWVQGSSKLCAIFIVEASPPATAAFRVGLRETGEAQAKA
jgi:hypothetical protein